jgi:hypothetical protein
LETQRLFLFLGSSRLQTTKKIALRGHVPEKSKPNEKVGDFFGVNSQTLIF